MVEVNYDVESNVKPGKFTIENILNGYCDIVLNDNITRHTRNVYSEEAQEEVEEVYYTYDIYRIVKANYRNELESELSKATNFNKWLRFAKEQYANQPIIISEDERISAVEQAITDIGEIIGEVMSNG